MANRFQLVSTGTTTSDGRTIYSAELRQLQPINRADAQQIVLNVQVSKTFEPAHEKL